MLQFLISCLLIKTLILKNKVVLWGKAKKMYPPCLYSQIYLHNCVRSNSDLKKLYLPTFEKILISLSEKTHAFH